MNHFADNKYTRWYYAIISNRQQNPISSDQYRERHHIVPNSFFTNHKRKRGLRGWLEGNSEDDTNLVWLSAREHFLCHWLLTKMTKHDKRAHTLMVYAFNILYHGNNYRVGKVFRTMSRAYERNKLLLKQLRAGNGNLGSTGRRAALDSSQISKIRALAHSGESATDIAKKFNLSRATIYRYLSENFCLKFPDRTVNNYKPKNKNKFGRPQSLSSEQVAELNKAYHANEKIVNLCSKFQVSRATLYRYIQKKSV